ncbi:hypothetical protein WMY93_021430 [Mugilogobius chulae]|uniref:Uncharacterized protein n=1 Tax=Mugilogobius chulae TaxID=88201 RepID=A0AAW0NBX2_9GOBI
MAGSVKYHLDQIREKMAGLEKAWMMERKELMDRAARLEAKEKAWFEETKQLKETIRQLQREVDEMGQSQYQVQILQVENQNNHVVLQLKIASENQPREEEGDFPHGDNQVVLQKTGPQVKCVFEAPQANGGQNRKQAKGKPEPLNIRNNRTVKKKQKKNKKKRR